MRLPEPGNWEKYRLVGQLRALRHLPPGTQLLQPDIQRDQDLLAALLRLQDEVDPVEWLKENHSDLIACMLLWTALNEVRSLLQSISLAAKAGHTAAIDRYRQWLGNLLNLPEDAAPVQQLMEMHPTTTPPELLRTVFQLLRAVRQGSSATSAVEIADDAILLLLDELFQSSEIEDPLQWIQEKHSELAAVQALHYLLAQIRPPDLLSDREVMKAHRLGMRLSSGGLSVVLSEIALGQLAFTLTLQTSIPERLLRTPIVILPTARFIMWEGDEQVVDNLRDLWSSSGRAAPEAEATPLFTSW